MACTFGVLLVVAFVFTLRRSRTPGWTAPSCTFGLLDIIGTFGLLGVICGADSWTENEAFGLAKASWLRSFLDLPNGIPSHDTFGRVFAALDPGQFERSFTRWVAALEERTEGQVIALDGKTLRRSHDRAGGKAALHLVNVWAADNRLVLAQREVDAKSNEITALPVLLEAFDVRDTVVTLDAMGCQTDVARRIVEHGADYVLALKGNQHALHTAVQEAFALAAADGYAGVAHDWTESVEKGHGRIETRRVTTLSEPEWLAHLNPDSAWAGLRCIVQALAAAGGKSKGRSAKSTATTSAAWRGMSSASAGRYDSTGALRTANTGSWIWRFGKTKAGSAAPPRTWRCYGGWR